MSPYAKRLRWLVDLLIPAIAAAVAMCCAPHATVPALFAAAITAGIALVGSAIIVRFGIGTERAFIGVGIALLARLCLGMIGVFAFTRVDSAAGNVAALVIGGGLAATVLAEAIVVMLAQPGVEHA